jgi:hypothetical protein
VKKSIILALFIAAFAAPAADASPHLIGVQYAQPICRYPAHWVWRGFWSCEYAAPVYHARPYYGYQQRYYGGHGGGRAHSGGRHGGHR